MTFLKSIGFYIIYCVWIIIGFLVSPFLFPFFSYSTGNFNLSYWLTFLVMGIWYILPPFIKLIIIMSKKAKCVYMNVEEMTLDNKFSNLGPAELLGVGFAFLSRGSFEDAIDAFEKGLRIDSNNFELHFRKGKAFMALGYFENALECYEIALNLNPDDSVILSNIKIAQYKLSKEAPQDELYKDLTESMEEFYEYEEPSMVWNFEGVQLQMLGEFKGANNYYKKALKIKKKNLYAIRNLKRLRKIRMKQYEFSL